MENLENLLEQLGSYVDMEETEESKAMNEEEKIYRQGNMVQTNHPWKEIIVKEVIVNLLDVDLVYIVTRQVIEDATEDELKASEGLRIYLKEDKMSKHFEEVLHSIIKAQIEDKLEEVKEIRVGGSNLIGIPNTLRTK